jgi:hypothetical protein
MRPQGVGQSLGLNPGFKDTRLKRGFLFCGLGEVGLDIVVINPAIPIDVAVELALGVVGRVACLSVCAYALDTGPQLIDHGLGIDLDIHPQPFGLGPHQGARLGALVAIFSEGGYIVFVDVAIMVDVAIETARFGLAPLTGVVQT